jgi:hypothetical protein
MPKRYVRGECGPPSRRGSCPADESRVDAFLLRARRDTISGSNPVPATFWLRYATDIQEEEVNAFPFGKPKSDAFSTGMEMRQYYAAMAMQALIASHPDQPMDFIAKRAFEQADAMIGQEAVSVMA